jgi:hypothetical protein
MRRKWHTLACVSVIALTAVWFLATAHEMACHGNGELSGDGADGCASTECVCICSCHAAVEPFANLDVCASDLNPFAFSEYVMLLGTSVSADIFRPPLANS